MKNLSEAVCAAAIDGSWTERVLAAQRRKLFDAFMLFRQGGADDTMLDVGPRSMAASPDTWSEATGSLVTSTPLDPAQCDARLPWPDASFDWVFCGEVIEHAGSRERQQVLTAECYRVARKGVFITTPNRRHPFEFNTGLPFVHWLPPARWRRLLGWSGHLHRAPFALLDAEQLYALAATLPDRPAHDVGHKRVFGIKAHFFLMIRKGA
jgi:hypothetical protein